MLSKKGECKGVRTFTTLELRANDSSNASDKLNLGYSTPGD